MRLMVQIIVTAVFAIAHSHVVADSARQQFPAEIGLFTKTSDGEWRLSRHAQKISYKEARRNYFGVVLYLPPDQSFSCRIKISYPGSLALFSIGPDKKRPPPGLAHEKDGILYIEPKATRCTSSVVLVGILDNDQDKPGRRLYTIYVDGKLVLNTYLDITK